MQAIKDNVRNVLADAQIDGTRLVLPNWLDRKDYKAVDEVLRNLGGTWKRQEKAHVFTVDPSEAIRQVVDTGTAPGPARTEEGYVRTPDELARRIVREFTDIGDWSSPGVVLEPSAGCGALVQAIIGENRSAKVVTVEPNQVRQERLYELKASFPGCVDVYERRLEEYLHAGWEYEFDAVVANPPFALPGRPTAWIDHTWHAWGLLKSGGRLTSIAPKGLSSRDDRKHREVRELIARYGGGWMDLEDDAFAESGTNVRAVVFWIDKPDREPEQDRPAKKRGKPTEEQKAERRAEDQELKAAVDEALEDDAFAQQLAGRVNRTPIDCRLRHYSPRNQALVFAQADALGVRVTGHLNTFKGWAEQGRMVVKGSTALRIVAAMGDEKEKADDQQEQPQGEETQPRRRFRFTTRFDFSQTKSIEDE